MFTVTCEGVQMTRKTWKTEAEARRRLHRMTRRMAAKSGYDREVIQPGVIDLDGHTFEVSLIEAK